MIDGGPVGTADIVLGRQSDQSPAGVEAYIDELRIFNTILSVGEQ